MFFTSKCDPVKFSLRSETWFAGRIVTVGRDFGFAQQEIYSRKEERGREDLMSGIKSLWSHLKAS